MRPLWATTPHALRVVWAPVGHDGAEIRVRVAEVRATTLVVKLPGSDAALVTVPIDRCYPSAGPPDTYGTPGQAAY